jgi:integrase/recombinase XerD
MKGDSTMFEKLFEKAGTVVAHRAAPYAHERELYLEHLASEGYSLASLRRIAPCLVAIAHELRDCPDLAPREEEIQAVTERATRLHSEFSVFGNVEHFRESFARETKRWLIFLGRFQPAKRKPLPFEKLIDHYAEWMKNERGLAPSTIEGRRWKLKWFLNWFSNKHRPVRTISLADVDEYQSECKAKGFSRVTLNDHACAIRSFLKHAGAQGWCSPSVAAGIRGPVIYQHESLPAGPSWDEVKRLLKALDTNDPLDIRDRAIIMLLAIYGLRAMEVSHLVLKDIDWDHELLTIRRSKQRHYQLYPLVPEVGQAIVRYLREVRPECQHQEIFITTWPPRRPVCSGTICGVVARRMQRLGIQSLPHHGAHALRHACAGHLVAKGLTLKEIGDHLGHKSASSTRIYAKVDLSGLREVASFDLGGVL